MENSVEIFQGHANTSSVDTRNPYDFDSVSMCSYQSTVYDSEFVAAEVNRYERNIQNQNYQAFVNPSEVQNNQINLSINLINANSSDVNKSKDNLSAKNPSEENSENNLKVDYSRKSFLSRFLKSPKFIIILLIFVALIVATVSLVLVISKKNDGNNLNGADTTTESPFLSTSKSSSTTEAINLSSSSTEVTTTAETSTSKTDSTEKSSTSTTTTEVPKPLFEIVPKTEWNSTVKGKVALKPPVERVIVLETITDQCFDKLSCLKFLRQRQLTMFQTTLNGFLMDNLPENFLISSDGGIYEGRGFFEGQHTYDQTDTSYNIKTLGISFMCENTEKDLNEKQIAAFNYLMVNFLEEGKIETNYKLYHRYQLVGGNETMISKNVKTWPHWKETPTIIRRNEWKADRRAGSASRTKIRSLVVVSDVEESSCFDLESCSSILRDRQKNEKEKYGDIKHNFIFAGDNLLFDGRGFDLSDSTLSGLQILFLGNFTELEPPQLLMKKLEIFLQYAIDLEKIETNFLLYGERQKNLKTPLNPGDALFKALQQPPFDKYFDFNTTEPEPCYFICN